MVGAVVTQRQTRFTQPVIVAKLEFLSFSAKGPLTRRAMVGGPVSVGALPAERPTDESKPSRSIVYAVWSA